MKLDKTFVLRKIADDYVIVPVGATAVDFNGIITVNDTGAFLWEQLKEEKTIDDLVNAMLDEYDIDEDTARTDVNEFINVLKEKDIL